MDTGSFDPATTAVLGLLGIQALTGLFQAMFGGGGERGMKERVTVVEQDVKHIAQDVRDIKSAMGLIHRDIDRDGKGRI